MALSAVKPLLLCFAVSHGCTSARHLDVLQHMIQTTLVKRKEEKKQNPPQNTTQVLRLQRRNQKSKHGEKQCCCCSVFFFTLTHFCTYNKSMLNSLSIVKYMYTILPPPPPQSKKTNKNKETIYTHTQCLLQH